MEKNTTESKEFKRKINTLSIFRKNKFIIRKPEPTQTLSLFPSVLCFIPLPKPDLKH